ncbi:acyl carrier protein 2, mitochondrial-like [Phoenix dactylifera]|uniref:Acyl carrier protein n=1 Tax=Phoenix dactylifera TaxID=42345 RepID=A0A8B7BYT8_PHODC|nr:acyl carrier protein 2, mitochondrial-like [Phoenix dactylifera]
MQAARNAFLLVRSFPPPAAPRWFPAGSRRVSSQDSAAAMLLEKQEVTDRVLDLLRSCPFIDPSKVSPTANFKIDLQLDMLDNVQVMVAAEEEFAVEIPNSEADKISSAAHLIAYIAAHPQAK